MFNLSPVLCYTARPRLYGPVVFMWLLVFVIALVSSLFFYIQAAMGGMGRKRWAFAGLLMGPAVWPVFSMQKRMKIYRLLGMEELVLKV